MTKIHDGRVLATLITQLVEACRVERKLFSMLSDDGSPDHAQALARVHDVSKLIDDELERTMGMTLETPRT